MVYLTPFLNIVSVINTMINLTLRIYHSTRVDLSGHEATINSHFLGVASPEKTSTANETVSGRRSTNADLYYYRIITTAIYYPLLRIVHRITR
jgi:hypothetical protein